jgi:hypothetical protein
VGVVAQAPLKSLRPTGRAANTGAGTASGASANVGVRPPRTPVSVTRSLPLLTPAAAGPIHQCKTCVALDLGLSPVAVRGGARLGGAEHEGRRRGPVDQVWEVLREVERWPEGALTVTSVRRWTKGRSPWGPGRVKQPGSPTEYVATELETSRSFTWVATGPCVSTAGSAPAEGTRHWQDACDSGGGAGRACSQQLARSGPWTRVPVLDCGSLNVAGWASRTGRHPRRLAAAGPRPIPCCSASTGPTR